MAGTLNLPLAFRHTPYKPDTIEFRGFDFTGATFLMHFRNRLGDTGTPVIALAGATAGTQGISITTETVESVTSTFLQIQIDEATMEALPSAAPTDANLVLAYDLHITPSGGVKKVWLIGYFTVSPGVTI